jgi:hypothetical protein
MTMTKLMAVLALGFALAGCGVAPEEEPMPPAEAAVTSPGETRAKPSESAEPELRLPDPSPRPICGPGEIESCTLGPPPVCTCVRPTIK